MMVVHEGLHWKQAGKSTWLEGHQVLSIRRCSFRENCQLDLVLTIHVTLLVLTYVFKRLRSGFLIESIDIKAVKIVCKLCNSSLGFNLGSCDETGKFWTEMDYHHHVKPSRMISNHCRCTPVEFRFPVWT